MRHYSYLYTEDPIQLIGILKEYERELNFLKSMYPNHKSIKRMDTVLMMFQKRYPDIREVLNKINEDKISPEVVNYYYEHDHTWPEHISSLGELFENDVNFLFELEHLVSKDMTKEWENLTPFDEICNGKDFMCVGHSSYLPPGVPGDFNYKENEWGKKYISCSLFSNSILDTFQSQKIVYVIPVTEENYIASSPIDCVTKETKTNSLNNIVEEDGTNINIGYTFDIAKAVSGMLPPKLIQTLTLERYQLEGRHILDDKSSLTNEVVLKRKTSNYEGALLIGDGCDFLLGRYQYLKENNIPFKCINKGLYREKLGLPNYTEKEWDVFRNSLENFDWSEYPNEILEGYYREVVLPMKYEKNIQTYLDMHFGTYIDIDRIKKEEREKQRKSVEHAKLDFDFSTIETIKK